MIEVPDTVTLAMHIPDNFISPSTGALFYVIMIPVWVLCLRYVIRNSTPEKMAYLGAGAAFSFLIMMFNVPTPGGTTAHGCSVPSTRRSPCRWPCCCRRCSSATAA